MLPGIFHFSILSHSLSLRFSLLRCSPLSEVVFGATQWSQPEYEAVGKFFLGALWSWKSSKNSTNFLSSFRSREKKSSTNFTKDREFSKKIKFESCVKNLLLFFTKLHGRLKERVHFSSFLSSTFEHNFNRKRSEEILTDTMDSTGHAADTYRPFVVAHFSLVWRRLWAMNPNWAKVTTC